MCTEGGISSILSQSILERGTAPEGDLIPWALANQFCDPKLTSLKGLRIVRIATHPDYQVSFEIALIYFNIQVFVLMQPLFI